MVLMGEKKARQHLQAQRGANGTDQKTASCGRAYYHRHAQ